MVSINGLVHFHQTVFQLFFSRFASMLKEYGVYYLNYIFHVCLFSCFWVLWIRRWGNFALRMELNIFYKRKKREIIKSSIYEFSIWTFNAFLIPFNFDGLVLLYEHRYNHKWQKKKKDRTTCKHITLLGNITTRDMWFCTWATQPNNLIPYLKPNQDWEVNI